MNNLEKLISNLSNYWDISPDKVVDRLNFMNEQEINKIVDKMTKKFKNGGFIDCLRNGGSVKDCGCGTKMVRKGAGGMESDEEEITKYPYYRSKRIQRVTDVPMYSAGDGEGQISGEIRPSGDTVLVYRTPSEIYTQTLTTDGNNYVDHSTAHGITNYYVPGSKSKGVFRKVAPAWLVELMNDVKGKFGDVPTNKNGGAISAQSGVKLRKDTIDNLVNIGGFTRQQARDAYRQQKQSVREQSGLYGAAMRQKARQNLNDAMALKSAPTLGLEDIVIPDEPIVMEDVKFDFGEAPVIKKMSVPTNTNVYANTMSKDAAFADARRRGFKTFKWNGQEYNTLYAEEKPKSALKTSISGGKPASGYLLANDLTPWRGGYTNVSGDVVRAMASGPSTMYPTTLIEAAPTTNYVESVPGSNVAKKAMSSNIPSETSNESAWKAAVQNGQLMTSTPLYTPSMDDPNIYQFGGGSRKATPAVESRRGWLGRAIRAMWDPGKYAK